MADICAACGSEGTLVVQESGIVCVICGVAAALPSTDADLYANQTSKTLAERASVAVKDTQRVSKDRVVQVYVYTLQSCLLEHVHLLIQKGVDPILESVARQIWMRTLSVSRCLESGIMHENMKKFSPLTSVHSAVQSVDAREKELQSEDRIYNHYASYTSCLYRFLDMEAIVWVLYAALVWMQEGITPVDLSLWIRNEEMPFMQLPMFQDKAESVFKVYVPKMVFLPKGIPSPLEIEIGATKLAEDIGLQLPPINVPLHIVRYLKALNLSDVIADQAVALYEMYWRGSEYEAEKTTTLYYPHMLPLSCILAALKVTVGLDDAQREVQGNIDWLKWAQEIWQQCIHPSEKYIVDVEKLMEMSSSDLKQFGQYVDRSICSAYETRKSYTGLDKQISKLVQNWTAVTQTQTQRHASGPRPVGVEFGMGDAVYVPSLYLYPCPMYWFINLGHQTASETDWHYPIDFVAVLSVLCGISNVKPKHLIACLASLEQKMIETEILCVQSACGKPMHVPTRITASMERMLIVHALQKMGYSEEDSQQIQALDKDQIEKLKQMAATRSEPVPPSDEALVMKAVGLFHASQMSKNLFDHTLSVPQASSEDLNPCTERHEWSEDPEALLIQAILARRLGQPIASLGAKLSTNNKTFHKSQTWAQDDLTATNVRNMI